MSFSLVAHTYGQGNSGGATSGSVNTTGANLIVLAVNYLSSTAPTISDSKSNTWTGLTAAGPANGSSGAFTRLYYCLAPTVGSGHTFTTSGASSYSSIAVQAWSGGAVSGVLDAQANHSSGSTVTSIQPGSLSPAFDNELFVASNVRNTNLTSVSIGSSFTISDAQPGIGGTSFDVAMAYKVQVVGSDENPTWSWSTSAESAAAMATFVSAARSPTTFYVDNAGSDSNDGSAADSAHAWQTCAKVSASSFVPGDVIIFTAGQTFAGPLTFHNKGTSGAYIRVGTGRNASASVPDFANGGAGDPWPGTAWSAASSPAQITVQDTYPGGVNINDCEYIWVDNLKAVGSGVGSTGTTSSASCGFSVKSTQASAHLRGVRLTALESKDSYWGAICWAPDINKYQWDGLQIYRCSFHDCRNTGLHVPLVINLDTLTGYNNNSNHASQNIYVGYTEVRNITGASDTNAAGFVFLKSTTGLIEYCLAKDVHSSHLFTSAAGTGGFQYLQATNYVTQWCEALGTRTTADHYDGDGFETEPGNAGGVWQYCYAHDNDGPGFGISGGTIRYCVSANNLRDASSVGTAVGTLPAEITHRPDATETMVVYGCTVIATASGKKAIGISSASTGNDYIYNNILVAPSGANVVDVLTLSGAIGNVYYANGGTVTVKNGASSYTSLASMRTAGFEKDGATNYGVFGDPVLRATGSAPSTATLLTNPVSTLNYWDPIAGSPAIDAGISYAAVSITPGSIDFRGNPNLARAQYDAGAVELPGVFAAWNMGANAVIQPAISPV